MSQLRESPPDDRQLVQYVLGLLSAEETDRLDEITMVDEEVAARLHAAENDLVDGYVRGTLDGETLERFKSYYMASPRRRSQVRFAASFVSAVDRAAVDLDQARDQNEAASPASSPRLVWKLWAVAALLVMAFGALMIQTVRQGNGLNELERQLAGERAANAAMAKELERMRDVPRPRATDAAPVPAAPAPRARIPQEAPSAPAIALILLPQTRAVGPASSVPTLDIPSGVERVAFELRLETNDFPRYQAMLRDPAIDRIVWRSGWISPKSASGESSVSIVVPVGPLKPQHYSLDLVGQAPGGGTRVAASYLFQVAPHQ